MAHAIGSYDGVGCDLSVPLCSQCPDRTSGAAGEEGYGAYLNFLHFGEATLTFPQTLVLRYARFEPERGQATVAEDYSKWFLARLRTLEPLLAQQQYLCAGRFTAADVSVGYALLLAQHVGLASRFTPAVEGYWQRLQQRDALRAQEAAAQAQGVSTVPAPDTQTAPART